MKTKINRIKSFSQTLEAHVEELQSRESVLSHLMNVSEVGLCYLDKNLRYIYINDWLADINGLPAEDHIGRSIRELFPDLADGVEKQFRQVIDTGDPIIKGRAYAEIRNSPGIKRLFEHNYYANKSSDGTVLGISCYVEDITERDRVKTAQREKQASDKRFRLLVESMVDGVSTLDKTGSITFVNDSACRMFGYEREELLGRTIFDLVDEENKKVLLREFTARHDGKKNSYEVQALRKNSQTIDVQITPQPLFDENGNFSGSLAVLRDITEQKRSLESLRESEAKFHAIFDRAGIAMLIVDDNKTIVQVNKATCDMLGYSEEELIGKNYLMIKLEEDKETSLKTYETVKRSVDDIQYFEKRYRKSDGSITWGLVVASKFKDKKNESYVIGMIQDITERKHAETALRESEEKFKAIFDNAAVSMAIVDNSKTIVQVNRSMCELLEYSEEELIGKSFLDITVEEDRNVSLEIYNSLKDSDKTIQRHEKRYRKSDGSIIWGLVAASKLYDKNDESFTIGMIQDITERKRAENHLRLSEAKFRTIFDRAGMAMAIVDSAKIIVQVNRAMCDMLKYSEEELIGKSFLDITVEDDRDISVKAYNTLQFSGDEIQRFEKRYRRSDGSIAWGMVAVSRFRDAEDESFRIGMIQDITERKQAETALRESEERLRQLVENLNEFVYLFDVKKMGAVYASPAYKKVYGRDLELLKNNPQDWRNAIHPEDLERVNAEFNKSMVEEIADLVYRVIHSDGSIHWIHDRCFPIYDDQGELTRFAGVAEDITDRKLREDQIQRQNRRLRQLVEERSQQALNSERLASVGRLTAGYTHQIRNPLQSIFCNIDRISALISGNSPAFREIDSMRGHLQRIADVARQMKYVYRPQESNITIFNVNDIITEAVDLYFSLMADAGIKISLDLCQPAAIAAGDETAIYTALGNLILNAKDAMAEGGSLKITTSVEDGMVRLSLADTGHGIPEEIMPRIFDPFFTTKSPDEGTGLGLTVVKESLESCGGSIGVTSEPGSGAVFTIHLSVKQET